MLCMCVHLGFAAYVRMKKMVDTYIDKYFVIVACFSLSITALTLPFTFSLSTMVEEKIKAELFFDRFLLGVELWHKKLKIEENLYSSPYIRGKTGLPQSCCYCPQVLEVEGDETIIA